jgi:hypothetical protein
MSDFTFEPDARGYSRENAYWLGRFADPAYSRPEAIDQAVNKPGLTTFQFFDDQHTDTQAFLAASRGSVRAIGHTLWTWHSDRDISGS